MPPADHISVFVVEDRDSIRNALELIIDGTPGMVCTGTFPDAESLLSSDFDGPHVVLLDIGLPGISGVEAVRAIRAKYVSTNVIMLTVHDDENLIFEALCEGASGYLLKNTPPAQILEAVRDVHMGGAPMTASVARKVVHFFRRPDVSEEGLTQRENEVLQHLMEGQTNRQIAADLFISGNTVAYHIKQIYLKLHVHSRAEAVAKAMKRGAR